MKYQKLLQSKYSVGGLQDPGYGIGCKFTMQKGPFIQILHVNGNHWICVSNMMSKKGMNCVDNIINHYYIILITGHIQVFDSLYNDISSDTVNQICSIVRSQKKSVTIEIMDVLKQCGSTDCGLFALAFGTSLCIGESPSEKKYIQRDLRAHLHNCFESDNPCPQPFPSSNRQKVPANLIKKTKVVPIFCHCRLPEKGNMIECCQCSEWYHEICETVDQEVWEQEDINWVCKGCSNRHTKRRK